MSNKRTLDQPLEKSPTTTSTHSKKVKFGALPASTSATRNSTFEPIDNATDLQFDELNQVGKIKKGRVKVDGYDSDSSTENTEVRKTKKKHEDDDIFADEEEPQDGKKELPKFDKIDVGLKVKKGAEKKDFLELGDIEGQEFGKEDDDREGEEDDDDVRGGKQQDNDSDYSDEEEDFVPGDEFANADDAPRARRKSKKGMGFLLSKFNMAEELQEGRLAADGSYVASAKDPEAVHDNWLEGMNKKIIKQAREAKRMRDEQLRTQAEKEEGMASLRTRKECYIALLGLLPAGDGRSVSQILCQLGNEKRALERAENKPKKKVVKKSAMDGTIPDSMVIDHRTTDDPPPERSNNASKDAVPAAKSEEQVKLDRRIGEITDLASMLMGTHGELDIYDMSHGSIVGILKSEGLVSRDWVPPRVEEEVRSRTDGHSGGATPVRPHSAGKPLISRPTTLAAAAAAATLPQSPQVYYKFIQPQDPPSGADPPVYGPFDLPTMHAWAQQGFFGNNFDRILVKIHLHSSDPGNAPWGHWDHILNLPS